MTRTRQLGSLLLPLFALLSMGTTLSECGVIPSQEFVDRDGYPEPHTPGSGDADEMETPSIVTELLGESPDLNRVQYLRTYLEKASGEPPRAILILIPGFLGGASTFDPLARDLVGEFAGQLEVWAADRRPNQLEDLVGIQHAATAAAEGNTEGIFEGALFYFPDRNKKPKTTFPGDEDFDIDLDGELDEQMALEDAQGDLRTFQLLAQDDLRYGAYWGLDTHARDWRLLVQDARARVGDDGLVLFGGHSMGTSWAGTYAAYDFNPDPAITEAAYEEIDGLLLLEGGGPGDGADTPPTLAEYLAGREERATPGSESQIFLEDFQEVVIPGGLGPAGALQGLASFYRPDETALGFRLPVFGSGVLTLIFMAPSTNRALLGMFIDDDFQPIGAFRASAGFSDNGPNIQSGLFGSPFVLAQEADDGSGLRNWKNFDDPTLPSCVDDDSIPCPDVDRGPRPDPDAPPSNWGIEVEVTDLETVERVQWGDTNFIDWYFLSSVYNADLSSFGRDSSPMVAESIALDATEGPLVVTQNANVDIPVLGIGGSHGLAPLESSFAGYLGSIATAEEDKRVVILEGYAHLDPLMATDNEAVPVIVDWVADLLQRKLLESF